MRLLLDQGLPRYAAEVLRAEGVECVHIGELGMSRARQFMAVAPGADFHAILAVQNAAQPSVIRIRLQGLNGPAIEG
ncbi:MAG: hypothetical protein JWP63_5950 [Candidatus Solibacter sp.]|nr:hypothetical protein [Candidatus Solibacter sp.]